MVVIDAAECARRGAIGAVGAVPGTLAAHPFDVIKMLQQVHGEGLLKTVAARAGTGGLAAFYHGVGAGVAQKVCTRGPVFLASELSTQTVQSATGLSRDSAVFFGSAISGYITGAAAAPAEWQKVQRGVAGTGSGLRSMLQARGGTRRVHGAGLRNGVFDCTFFGTEHALSKHAGASPAASYACAAAMAVALDFPLDVAVKRSMAAPLSSSVELPLSATLRLLRERRWNVFRGLAPKAVEFAVSYAVTGYVSSFVVAWLS